MFKFSGQTTIHQEVANVQGEGAIPITEQSLVIMNGKEAALNKSFADIKGGTYKLVMLRPTEAVKKYGAKGKFGAVEIQTL